MASLAASEKDHVSVILNLLGGKGLPTTNDEMYTPLLCVCSRIHTAYTDIAVVHRLKHTRRDTDTPLHTMLHPWERGLSMPGVDHRSTAPDVNRDAERL